MKFLLSLLTLLISISVSAQDTIQIKNQAPIGVKVIKISDEIVQYKLSNYLDGPILEATQEDIGYLSLNGQEYLRKEEGSSSAKNGGMILRERRHYLGAGLGIYLKNSDEYSPGFSYLLEGTYFITPIFGMGLAYNYGQLSYRKDLNLLQPDTNGIVGYYTQGTGTNHNTSVSVNNVLLMPTFSLPLKFMSIDYKLFAGASFGKLNETSTTSANYFYIEQNRQSGSLMYSRANYEVSESKSLGYAMGAGTAFRFNISKKHPITFSVGMDFIYTRIKFEYDVSARLDTGETSNWEEDVTYIHKSLRPYAMFVYSFQKGN